MREFPVALIVAGHGHYSARSVIHQDKIGDENGHSVVSKGMNREAPGVHAELFHRCHICFGNFDVALLGDELLQRRITFGGLQCKRVLCCHSYVAHTHKRIWPRRVNRQRAQLCIRFILHGEVEFDALRATDPVCLHSLHFIGPAIELVEVFEQLVTEIGNLDKPLRDFSAFDECARAPATAIDNLLIGEHGLVDGVPVNLGFFLVHEALFEESGEKPLLPPIIVRVACRHFAAPVVRIAEALQLLAHIVDIAVGPFSRRGVVFHCGIFCGETEGVPAHRLQHILAEHALEARDDIADRVITHMTHMEVTARVRKHR